MTRITLFVLLLSILAVPALGQRKQDKKKDTRPEWKPTQKVDVKVSERALKIHMAGQLFDGHNDLPMMMRARANSSFKTIDIAKPTKFHTDIPRLKAGGLKAQYWSVYVPASTDLTGNALLQTLEQIEIVEKMVATYPDVFAMAKNADELEKIIKQGKVACMMGIEGGHSIQGMLAMVERFFDRGVRYMTLTHSKTLAWADSATDDAKNNGLSPFGKEVIKEMNRVGMLVDLSHVSEKTMLDALETTKAPVIFSHSSARAICDHPRNVSDKVLKLVKENNGVVMVNFMSGYIVPTEQKKKFKNARGTIYDVVDHIEHIIKVAGIDHVGIGSDYDGVRSLPIGLEDVSTYPRITQILLDRGYNETQIHKILGGNAIRALRDAEKVSAKLKSKMKTTAKPKDRGKEDWLGNFTIESSKVHRPREIVGLVVENPGIDLPEKTGLIRAETSDGREFFGQLVRVAKNLAIVKFPAYDLKANTEVRGKLFLRSKSPEQEFSFEDNKNVSTKIKFGRRAVAEYMREPVDNSSKERRMETYKVYHHVYDFAGRKKLTKGAGGLFPHHRGIFYGFNRISYDGKKADTWHCNNGESQTHAGFKSINSGTPGAIGAQQVCLINWNGRDGKTFAKEERKLSFYQFRDGLMINVDSKLSSAIDSPITLDGDPQHAGVQFRASQHVPDKTKKQTYYIRPDGKGKPGKFRNWPQNKKHVDLPWNAMCFVVDGRTYTCVYFNHADNPKNTRFSERDYGRFGAYFKYTLTREKPLHVQYRYWIQPGEMTVEEIQKMSDSYRNPLRASAN